MNPYERLHRAMLVQGLSTVEKAVLVALVAHADEAGDCWPSQARICHYASCCERAARKALAELEVRGLVEVHRSKVDGNRYRVLFASFPPRIGSGMAARQAPDAGACGTRSRQDRHRVPEPPAPRAAEVHRDRPSEESQENHTADAAAPEQALRLVRVFHRDVRQVEVQRPLLKELALAEGLVREHGADGAWWIATYAARQIERTHFPAATFGAVRQYVEEALARRPMPEPPRPPPAWPLDPPLTREEADALALGIADGEWLDRGYSEGQVAALKAEADAILRPLPS